MISRISIKIKCSECCGVCDYLWYKGGIVEFTLFFTVNIFEVLYNMSHGFHNLSKLLLRLALEGISGKLFSAFPSEKLKLNQRSGRDSNSETRLRKL